MNASGSSHWYSSCKPFSAIIGAQCSRAHVFCCSRFTERPGSMQCSCCRIQLRVTSASDQRWNELLSMLLHALLSSFSLSLCLPLVVAGWLNKLQLVPFGRGRVWRDKCRMKVEWFLLEGISDVEGWQNVNVQVWQCMDPRNDLLHEGFTRV